MESMSYWWYILSIYLLLEFLAQFDNQTLTTEPLSCLTLPQLSSTSHIWTNNMSDNDLILSNAWKLSQSWINNSFGLLASIFVRLACNWIDVIPRVRHVVQEQPLILLWIARLQFTDEIVGIFWTWRVGFLLHSLSSCEVVGCMAITSILISNSLAAIGKN